MKDLLNALYIPSWITGEERARVVKIRKGVIKHVVSAMGGQSAEACAKQIEPLSLMWREILKGVAR